MTIWAIPKLWPGETVAIIAGGPSVNQALADSVRQHKRIVVNHAYMLAPDADMLLALDSDPAFFAQAFEAGFAGLMLCGGVFELPGVHYIGQRFERIVLGVNHIIETRNSGLTAIRIAAEAGAAKILLLGFDPERHGHFEGYADPAGQSTGPEPYQGMTAGLAAIIAELRAKGIEVERTTGAWRIANAGEALAPLPDSAYPPDASPFDPEPLFRSRKRR